MKIPRTASASKNTKKSALSMGTPSRFPLHISTPVTREMHHDFVMYCAKNHTKAAIVLRAYIQSLL